ncbi:hypothetical protein F5882DRAFT_404779, partial [Hyaloscypha sp. PMI_1271]
MAAMGSTLNAVIIYPQRVAACSLVSLERGPCHAGPFSSLVPRPLQLGLSFPASSINIPCHPQSRAWCRQFSFISHKPSSLQRLY